MKLIKWHLFYNRLTVVNLILSEAAMTSSLTSNTARERGWESSFALKMILCRVPPFTSMLDSVCSFESTQYRRWLTMSVQRDTGRQKYSPGHYTCVSLCCLKSHWLPFIAFLTFCLPRVMPFGHMISSVTKAKRSPPFNPLLSILACSPQSVQ